MRLARALLAILLTSIVAVTVSPVAASAAPGAALRRDVKRAAAYGADHGVKTGIAVLDTRTGRLYLGGYAKTNLPSASVVKVYMAIFLLKTDRMHGSDARRAWPMITRSDNAAFVQLLKKYFGSSPRRLFAWMKRNYRYSHMGAPAPANRCWGGTRMTAQGIARLYAKVLEDDQVRPWLLRAMHHFVRRVHGFNQAFGIPVASKRPAIKQGWSDGCSSIRPYRTVLNSTGFARRDRYTVAIFTDSKATIGAQRKVIDRVARIALRYLPK